MLKIIFLPMAFLLLVSCVTETVTTSPTMKFDGPATVSVQDPSVHIPKGSTIAWSPETTNVYKDERLDADSISKQIETEIENNLKARGLHIVESVNGARYAIAYTAALDSALNDRDIIQRFGLLPGSSQIPENDKNMEKGSLIIYVFESQTGNIVWRSITQTGVKFDRDKKDRAARIKQIISEMFLTFPQ